MNQEGSASNHLVTKSYVDTHSSNNNYVKTDGSSFMSGDLNMNEQRVENMLDPVNEQDAVNRRYLESQLNDYLKRDSQSPMTFNLDMNNYKIVNLKNYNPNNNSPQDVPNLKYIDDYFGSRRSGILQDNLNANNNKIINLTYPTNIEDATNKQYADQNFLNIDGNNNMQASLNMNSQKITNVLKPDDDGDATNKKYVDERIIKAHITGSHVYTNVTIANYLCSSITPIASVWTISISQYRVQQQ